MVYPLWDLEVDVYFSNELNHSTDYIKKSFEEKLIKLLYANWDDFVKKQVSKNNSCSSKIFFQTEDLNIVKKSLIEEDLTNLTVVEYNIKDGFVLHDETYAQYLNDIEWAQSLVVDGSSINDLLDEAYYVELSVPSVQYIPCDDCALFSASDDSLDGVFVKKNRDVYKKIAPLSEKFKNVGYMTLLGPYFNSAPVIGVAKFLWDVSIDKTKQKFPDEVLEAFIKATVNGLNEGASNCDDCFSFKYLDNFNALRENQLAKKALVKREDVYNNSWAVIVGINQYSNGSSLNWAVKDAENIKDLLINSFGFDEKNVLLLCDEEATLSGIKSALNEVSSKAREQDRIVVFFSGHGQTLSTKDGSDLGYLIPFDGDLESPYSTGLAMEEVHKIGRLSEAKHMLFLVDACYSGLMAENRKGLSTLKDEGYLYAVANKPARQIITAGQKDQQVIEREEWKNSAFTKNLLAALNEWLADIDGDGYITAEELGLYLKKTVTEDSNQQQTPYHSRFIKSGDGDFIFFKGE